MLQIQVSEIILLSDLRGVWHNHKSLVNPEIVIKQRNSLFYILFLRELNISTYSDSDWSLGSFPNVQPVKILENPRT